MSAASMTKPCRLEINAQGSWDLVGVFDVADDDHASDVMDAAERLIQLLNERKPSKQRATLRICIEGGFGDPLARWKHGQGWHHPVTGEPL